MVTFRGLLALLFLRLPVWSCRPVKMWLMLKKIMLPHYERNPLHHPPRHTLPPPCFIGCTSVHSLHAPHASCPPPQATSASLASSTYRRKVHEAFTPQADVPPMPGRGEAGHLRFPSVSLWSFFPHPVRRSPGARAARISSTNGGSRAPQEKRCEGGGSHGTGTERRSFRYRKQIRQAERYDNATTGLRPLSVLRHPQSAVRQALCICRSPTRSVETESHDLFHRL